MKVKNHSKVGDLEMSRIWIRNSVFALAIVAMHSFTGCTARPSPQTAAGTGSASPQGSAYQLEVEPVGARGVKEARSDSKDGDEVTIVGQIGGDPKPWVEGQAAFILADSSLKPCAPDEGCPTPWDCCCDPNVSPETKTLVKVVDANNKTVPTDAKELLGLKELQTVVVHGRAKRDEAGNLTVLADGVFVRK